MNKSEQTYRKYYSIVCISYLFLSFASLFYQFIKRNRYYIFLSLVAPLFLLIPKAIDRIFHFEPVYSVRILFQIYFLFSFLIGMVFGGYLYGGSYDKFVHTLSGFFFAYLGLMVFYFLKPQKEISPAEFFIVSFFCTSFSLAVAAVWEIYEYVLNLLIGTDPQNVLSTGIHDTMLDIIVCFAGALLYNFFLYYFFRKQKSSIFTASFIDFFNKNIKKY